MTIPLISSASGDCETFPFPHSQHPDLAAQWRIRPLVQVLDDVVSQHQGGFLVQPAARQADQVRCVQPRVLGVDGDEQLDDLVRRQPVKNYSGHLKIVVAFVVDELLERRQPMLAVNCAQAAFLLRQLEQPHRVAFARDKLQWKLRRNDHRAGDRREVPVSLACREVGDQLGNLLADDGPLIGLFARSNPLFQQFPVDALCPSASPLGGRGVFRVASVSKRTRRSTSDAERRAW